MLIDDQSHLLATVWGLHQKLGDVFLISVQEVTCIACNPHTEMSSGSIRILPCQISLKFFFSAIFNDIDQQKYLLKEIDH